MRRGRPRYFKEKHRNPPMPPWFKDCPWGVCRWCGKLIWNEKGVNKRRHWHAECLPSYWIVADHKYAKAQVKKRDKGICALCGTLCVYRHEWQLDHIVPLIDANGNIKYWELGNLQTLCNKCHGLKTALENSQRKAKN